VHVCFVIALLLSHGEASGVHPARVPVPLHCRRLHVFWGRSSGRNVAARPVQRKKRTHVPEAKDPAKKGDPKSFVFRRGRHGVCSRSTPQDCCMHSLAPSRQQRVA